MDTDECDPGEVEQPGDAARRQEVAYQKRRSRGREKLRGLGGGSQLMQGWFFTLPANQQLIIDGKNQELAEDVVARAIHVCLFLPKFHCELNWIERVWGAAKTYARSNCMYSLPGLQETMPIALSQDISDLPEHLRGRADLPACPLYAQRRFARVSRQYMHEYRKGANACDAIRNVSSQRTQKRHRDTSDSRSRQLEASMAALSGGM